MGELAILQIERVYYAFIAVVGVPVNVVAIVIISRGKCGLSRCISYYLVGMSAADLLVVISEPILYRNVQVYFPDSVLSITPICSYIYFQIFASTMVSAWFTVAFTFDRHIAICCDQLKVKYCTRKVAAAVLGTVCILGSLLSVPWYFRFEPGYVTNGVPWYCVTKSSFYTSHAWSGFVISFAIINAVASFLLILLFNILTVRRIQFSNRVRSEFRGGGNAKDGKDLELENRRKSIVLLFSISSCFLLLWITQVIFYTYQRIANLHSYSTSDNLYIVEVVANMLQILSSCTNIGIYVLTQRKFREELKKIIKYPLKLISNLFT